MNNNLLPQSRVLINLDAVANNVRELKSKCAPDVALMAVVKANGYGHGAVAVAKTAIENGASFLGVARIHEAVELRKVDTKLCGTDIDIPILLFGDVLPSQVQWLAKNNIRITIGSIKDAQVISKELLTLGQKIKVHLKIDTGMGRLGFVIHSISSPSELDNLVDELMQIIYLDGIEVEGIYTHFANADLKDKSHANEQIQKFSILIDALAKRGFKPKICHAANSAAIMDIPDGHFNMVRAGIAMYGLFPSDEVNNCSIKLEPVMSVLSKIVHIKDVPTGFKVSYGSTHITSSPTKIATIPIGYADGYSRLLSSKGEMLVRGARCKVIGRVCMDSTMIDVGHISEVEIGDEVVIMGKQGNQEISADEIARQINTINYEVVCSFNRRMPIIYVPQTSRDA